MIDREKIIEIFKASPTPTSILKPSDATFIYVQVNDAYCEMTQTGHEELIGNDLFEKFPANPDEKEPYGATRLLRSFEKVLYTRKEDKIPTIRYDLMLDGKVYKEIYWKVINKPVLDDNGDVEFIINSATPITEQVLSERARNLMLNNTEDSFLYMDRSLNIVDFNTKFFLNYKDIFDGRLQRNTKIFEHIQADQKDEFLDIFERVLSGETITFDNAVNDINEGKRYFTVNIKPAINEGEIVGIFISLLEKTDEQLARMDLRRKEERFRALVENGNDIVLILDPEGKPKYASPSHEKVLGYTQDEVLEMVIFNYVHPEDIQIFHKEIEECLQRPGEPIDVTPTRLKDKSGCWRWFHGTITNLLHESAVEGLVGNFREITDRIEAEKQVIRSKEKYQSLIDTIDGIVWEVDQKTQAVTYISKQITKILGYPPSDWLDTTDFWNDMSHPDDRESTVKQYQKYISAGLNHELEYRIKNADGKFVWIRDLVSVEPNEASEGLIRGLMMDISEEKELQRKLTDAYRLSKIGNWELDLLNEKLNWSKFVKELHEVPDDYTPDLGTAINFYKDGWSKKRIEEAVKNAIYEEESFDEELIIITAKGNERWVRAVGRPDFVDGKCIRVFGSTQDITNRKEAEIKLEQTNESLKERIKEQRCLYRISNLDENKLKIKQLLGKAASIIPKGFFASDLAQVQINWNESVINSPNFTEISSTHKISEQVKNERSHLEIMIGYPDAKDLTEYIGILKEEKVLLKAIIYQLFQKIEQILTNEDLKSIQQKYRNVVEYSTNMFYQHDTQGVLTYVSPQSSWFLGYPPEEAKIKWTEFITDNPINSIGERITQKAIDTAKTQEPYELQLKTGDDRIIWVDVREAPIKKDGKVVGIVGSLTDITERKQIEEDLKISLERFDYIKKATRDAIYDWDIENDTFTWGAGFKTLFGYDPNTHQERSDWIKHIHPDDIENVIKDLEFTLNDFSMNQWIIEYRYKSKAGHYSNIISNGYIVRDEDGNAVRMIGALRDITDQKLTEKELIASLKEKETLLAEIHHRVKNNLAVVSGMMQLQAYESHNDSVQEHLYDSVVRIKTMATVHELLYQSNSFSQLDFSDTLKELVQNVTDTLQSENEVSMEFNSDPVKLNINQAIPTSLIVNEVITNAFKHAFDGIKDCKIRINLQQDGDSVNLTITDNGTGLPDEINSSSNSSLGFHLINLLSEQVNAEQVYEKNKNEPGTIFQIQFEKQDNKKGIGSSSIT